KATALKALHVPGTPLRLANVYDAASARAVAALPGCRALATASYALAQMIGKTDETISLDDTISLVRPIAAVATDPNTNLPLTVDLQDGYAGPGDMARLREVVRLAITELGAAGANIEDSWHENAAGEMMGEDEAVVRIGAVLGAAAELGVRDFVLNARSDTFHAGAPGGLDESIRRGKRYLRAGATTVFILWPRAAEMRAEDVRRAADELGGMVNVTYRRGGTLTAAHLARLGVARISMGPHLYLVAAEARSKAASD
ncbi:phosphoenolpyruvate phosphomutase-domain-containing protein, partial [Lasiosphaeria miniovina]